MKEPIKPGLCITSGTTPIVYFGKYQKATACTISINPSDREFLDKNGKIICGNKVRLCSRDQLKIKDHDELGSNEIEIVKEYCENYFYRNPYKPWFNKYDMLLQQFNLSYYKDNVVHLDLVQWATTPFWNDLESEIKRQLLNADLPFLKSLLEKRFKFIFLNGKTVVNEVSKHLELSLNQYDIALKNLPKIKVYIGKYEASIIIGWSIYLQSRAVNSYENVRKIANEIKLIYEEKQNYT